MGRVCWSDLIRNTRTMSRLIWFHVPPLFTPKTPQEIASGKADRGPEEIAKVMAEKRLALDLIEGYARALSVLSWM
jgi:putative membrane protein